MFMIVYLVIFIFVQCCLYFMIILYKEKVHVHCVRKNVCMVYIYNVIPIPPNWFGEYK